MKQQTRYTEQQLTEMGATFAHYFLTVSKELENWRLNAAMMAAHWPAAMLVFSVDTRENNNTADQAFIQLQETPFISARHLSNAKGWIFSLSFNYQYATDYDRANIKKELKEAGTEEPNSVKVLSTKKVQQWVDYLNAIHAKMLQVDQQQSEKVTAFIASIEACGLPCDWDRSHRSGRIVRGGLEYSFNIDKGGSISQSVKIHHTSSNTLAGFLLLSDNKVKTEPVKPHQLQEITLTPETYAAAEKNIKDQKWESTIEQWHPERHSLTVWHQDPEHFKMFLEEYMTR